MRYGPWSLLYFILGIILLILVLRALGVAI